MTQTYFTRDEAADYMRVSVVTIDRFAREGKLTRHYLAGTRSVRFLKEDLDALVVPEGGPKMVPLCTAEGVPCQDQNYCASRNQPMCGGHTVADTEAADSLSTTDRS